MPNRDSPGGSAAGGRQGQEPYPGEPVVLAGGAGRTLKGLPPAGLEDTFAIARSPPHGHFAAALGTIGELSLEQGNRCGGLAAADPAAVMITAAVIDGSSELAGARASRPVRGQLAGRGARAGRVRRR